jgi:surfactin synthase thioesterase subunit
VTVASTLQGETMGEIATFALAGISMGGYICLEIMRRAL